MMSKIIAPIIYMLFLGLLGPAGCASSADSSSVPGTEFINRPAPLSKTPAPNTKSSLINTREVLKDPAQPLALATAITLALQNDRQIKIARLNVGIAEDRMVTARSFYLPHLKVSAGETWLDKQPGIFDPETKHSFLAGEKSVFRADAKLMIPVYDFGRTSAACRQAGLYRMSQESIAARTRQEIVYEVTESYFAVLRIKRMLQVAHEALELTAAHLKQAGAFFAQGLVDKRDVLQAELQLAQVKQTLFQAENGYEMTISSFNTMIGCDINRPTQIIDILAPRPFAIDIEACMSAAEQNRPELNRTRIQQKMARAGLDAARAEKYPKIAALTGFGYNDDEYQLRDKVWSGYLGLELDLFNGGMKNAQVREAEKRLAQTDEVYEELRNDLKLQVKGAYLAVVEAEKKLSVTEKAIEQARENLRIVKNQYATNVASSTDVLDAQTLFTRTTSDHYHALYYLNAALARLEWAMGTQLSMPANIKENQQDEDHR